MAKVRIGKILIEFDDVAELDAFVARHANSAENGGSEQRTEGSGHAGTQAAKDQTLLKMFVSAGTVEAGTVARLLGGVKGRGVRPAVNAWGVRVGLSASDDDGVCIQSNVGRNRGWKLSAGALGAAKAMLGEGGNQ